MAGKCDKFCDKTGKKGMDREQNAGKSDQRCIFGPKTSKNQPFLTGFVVEHIGFEPMISTMPFRRRACFLVFSRDLLNYSFHNMRRFDAI